MLRRNLPMTVFLFMIMTLHTATLGCIQLPHTALSLELAKNPIFYRTIFYATAIVISLLHQPISKRIGLKMELAGGVLSSALGMLLIITHSRLFSSNEWIMSLAMILMGIAMLSVINCLITYVTLVFTNKTILGITGLFAFGNGGLMLAPYIIHLGMYLPLTELLFFLVALLLMYGAGILILFDEPPHSKEAESYSGAYLRQSMPLRLSFYILAIVCYGLIEGTFNLWGAELLIHHFSLSAGEKAVSFFSLSMMISQACLLLALRVISPRKIYPLAGAIILIALLCTPLLSSLSLVLLVLMLGAVGCATVFPTTLSFLEQEILLLSRGDKYLYLPLIEHGISWMMSGYLFGIGLMDIATDWSDAQPRAFFFFAPLYLFLYFGLMVYLNKSRKEAS